MAKLEVQIGAEIQELNKKLSDAQKNIKGFSNSADKNLSKFSKSTNNASKSMGNLQKGAGNGSSAMLAFSRTVQDAPFGLMGVSNNITNLTEQFGALKNRTGSAGGALKLMLKDLKGFGGITLAISLATSAMLMFGDKIFKTKDKVKELKKEQEELSKSLENYVFQLDAVSKANIKGEQSATKELTTLRLLKSQIEDTTLSTDRRKDAINELRKKYPGYLKDMSDEKILNGGLEKTYNSLTVSIMKRARATASMNAIIKNSEDLLTIESQLASKQDEANKLQEKAILLNKQADKATGSADLLQELRLQASRTSQEVAKVNKEIAILTGQKQTLELTNIDLESNISNEGGIASKIFPSKAGIDKAKNVFIEEIKVAQDDIIEELINTDTNYDDWNTINWDEYYKLKELENVKLRLMEFSKDVGNIIQNNVASAFMGLGNAIGGALTGAGNLANNLSSALLGAMGGVLTQLGQMAIAVGVSLKAIKVALKSLNPAVAIGAGVALIAVGSAFSNKASSLGNSIGSNSSSNAGSDFSSSGSSFGGGSSFNNGGGTVVFEIAGTKLVGVLRNTLSSNRSLGGTLIID